MVAQSIESLKHEYTDKYVVVDASRPELARFRDVVGQVKTVNMSGRALVEFIDYHLNIGWYDIAPEFLKVVDKPLPKVEKPAAKKEAKPAAAKPAPAAKPEAAAKPGRPSVAEMLAAARGEGGAPAPAKPAPATPAAKPQATAAAKPTGKLSTTDILAAARGKVAAATQAAAPAAKAPVEEVEEKPALKVEVPAPVAKTQAASEKVDRTKMSVAEMIAWCRTHDAK